jgi:molybdenum cofactor cytidylyltransferase
MNEEQVVGAVVLAAGLSTRMGRPKMTLPWNDSTVIGKVVSTLMKAQIEPIVVVTGGAHTLVVEALKQFSVKNIFNPNFANGEMLDSLQVGLSNMPVHVNAALIVLGDQPLIEEPVVRAVVEKYILDGVKLVVPSFRMRRGHPWLVDRQLWPQILALKQPQTLRDFMQANDQDIRYVIVDTPSILQDIDTPEDYSSQQPDSRH